jgi:Zn-dependent M28 family amino/carboxypeptidase
MRRIILQLVSILILLSLLLQAKDKSNLNNFINYFDIHSVKTHLLKLTGERKVWFEKDSVFIKSRHAERKGNAIAEEYISRQLISYGYKVDRQNPFQDCVNIIAIKKGIKFPEKYILIGAHYDSMPDYSKAPGADDNASGTVCVLEAARLFNDIQTDYSIMFALWDEEESPSPMGSEYFAESALEENLNICEVINIDMIAYDSNDDGKVIVNRSNFDSDLDIKGMLNKLNNELSLKLDIHYRKTYTRSDDRAFAREGYNTIGFIEMYHNSTRHRDNDFNPDWHTSYDTLENFNWSYYERNCKLVISLLFMLTNNLSK